MRATQCICLDSCPDAVCDVPDAEAAVRLGFDGVKLDGCGKQMDLDSWAAALSAASPSKRLVVENCHWGGASRVVACLSDVARINDTLLCSAETLPTMEWCPFDFYRTSYDISTDWHIIMRNLASVFPHADAGLSRPGCWAYPGALRMSLQLKQKIKILI